MAGCILRIASLCGKKGGTKLQIGGKTGLNEIATVPGNHLVISLVPWNTK
jgi:hypothetical protein